MTDEEAKNKGGRPALPEAERRRHDGRVRYNDAELADITAAAKLVDERPGTYARKAAVAKARRDLAAARRRDHDSPPSSA